MASAITYYQLKNTTMMKLSCKDIDPNIDCDFEATGNSTREIAQKMLSHMKKEHPDSLGEMDMTDSELMDMFEAKAHA